MFGTDEGPWRAVSPVLCLTDIVVLSLLGFLSVLVLLQLVESLSLLVVCLDDGLLVLRAGICEELHFLKEGRKRFKEDSNLNLVYIGNVNNRAGQ